MLLFKVEGFRMRLRSEISALPFGVPVLLVILGFPFDFLYWQSGHMCGPTFC